MVVHLDLADELIAILLALNHRQQVGKTNDGIQRSTDFMTHVSDEGSLQAIAFLSLITGIDQGCLHMFLIVDTHGGSHYQRRHTFLIAIGHRSKTLLPIRLSCGTTSSLILLLVNHLAPRNQILKRGHHTLGIVRRQKIRDQIERRFCGCEIIIGSTTEIGIEGEGSFLSINMPCGQFHGLQHQIILNIILTHAIEFLQLLTDLEAIPILND